MPNARTHRNLSALATLSTIPISLAAGLPLLQIAAGSAVTLLPEFTPDLDIAHRRFGVLGTFIGLKSYAELVPHRAGFRKKHWSRLNIWNIMFLSHIPFVGTLLRTVMLMSLVFIAALFLNLDLEWLLKLSFWTWIGMSWSDCWHSGADLVQWAIKRKGLEELGRPFWRHRKRSFYKDRRKARY